MRCRKCDRESEPWRTVCPACLEKLPDPQEGPDAARSGADAVVLVSEDEPVEIGAWPREAAAVVAATLDADGIAAMASEPTEMRGWTRGAEVGLRVIRRDAARAWRMLWEEGLIAGSDERTGAGVDAGAVVLCGSEVYAGETHLPVATVVIAGGVIADVLPFALEATEGVGSRVDCGGLTLAAGLVDLHTHGWAGVDVGSAGMDAFARMAWLAPQFGVTTFLPTVAACSMEELATVFECFAASRGEAGSRARTPGLHLEGPFLNPRRAGSQAWNALATPASATGDAFRRLLARHPDLVARVTIAPELDGAEEMIRWLVERGIRVSLGHSEADYDVACAAFDAGATMVTHIYNAMGPTHHRAPGLIGAALEAEEVFVELICDGVHLHPATVAATLMCKGPERAFIASDTLAVAGTEEVHMRFGAAVAEVRDGAAWLANGTLAGSTSTLDAMLACLVNEVGWSLGEALTLCSATPTAALGTANAGALLPGAPADIVALNSDLSPAWTMVAGQVAFRRG